MTKQAKKRDLVETETSYVDSNRNISVALGEGDLKADLTERGLGGDLAKGGPGKQELHREAIYHSKKGNLVHAKACVVKAQTMAEETDFEVLTTQAEIEFLLGEFSDAYKTAGRVVTRSNTNKWKAMLIKADCLFNMCDFEHALIVYHRGKIIKIYFNKQFSL